MSPEVDAELLVSHLLKFDLGSSDNPKKKKKREKKRDAISFHLCTNFCCHMLILLRV